MEITILWTAGTVIVLTLLLKYAKASYQYRLLPGPVGLPFIGNIHQLDLKAPHKTITKWSEKYGDVFKISAFGKTTVILNSYNTIHEGLVRQSKAFAGRSEDYRNRASVDFTPNIAFTSLSDEWVAHKKIVLQTLKMYGNNLEQLEAISLDVIGSMLHTEKKSVYVRQYILSMQMMYGCRLDNTTLNRSKEAVDDLLRMNSPAGHYAVLDLMPPLQYIPNPLNTNLLAAAAKVKQLFTEKIQERRLRRTPGQPVCFVDGLLEHQNGSNQGEGSTINLSDAEIYAFNNDIFIAGTFSTATTMDALIAVLINKPDIQENIATEISEKVGNRSPRLEDRKTLHYVEGAILEILRYSSMFVLNLPHKTIEETVIDGYTIPKGTEVLFNLWNLHHDPTLWDEPWEFKPSRYLTKDGTLVPADHECRRRLFAFGAGRRSCPGEILARNRLFLMVTSMVQHFRFLPAGMHERPLHDPRDYTIVFGIEPKRYRLQLQLRN